MNTLRRARALAAAGLFSAALLPLRAAAQADSAAAVRQQAISVLPIHAVIGFYAGDCERVISPTSTLGVGASWFDVDAVEYASAELKSATILPAIPCAACRSVSPPAPPSWPET